MNAPKDGRQVGLANETNVLRALHRFGWLRTRDLACLVWQAWAKAPAKSGPNLTPPAAAPSSIRMAQRTLARLREKRLILSSSAPNGSLLHALSERGARVLQAQGIPAVTGKDLVRDYHAAYFMHRNIANQIAIGGIRDGFRVATEREVSQGRWLGGVGGVFGKKPDVLLRAGRTLYWVEVERSRKNKNDYARLLEWLDSVWRSFPRPGDGAVVSGDMLLRRIVFVCTPAFAKRLASDLRGRGWSDEQFAARLHCETLLYSFEAIAFF